MKEFVHATQDWVHDRIKHDVYSNIYGTSDVYILQEGVDFEQEDNVVTNMIKWNYDGQTIAFPEGIVGTNSLTAPLDREAAHCEFFTCYKLILPKSMKNFSMTSIKINEIDTRDIEEFYLCGNVEFIDWAQGYAPSYLTFGENIKKINVAGCTTNIKFREDPISRVLINSSISSNLGHGLSINLAHVHNYALSLEDSFADGYGNFSNITILGYAGSEAEKYAKEQGHLFVNIGSNYSKYIDDKVASIVDSAPETLDTLKELSAALGNDKDFATTVTNQLANKISQEDLDEALENIVDDMTYTNEDALLNNVGGILASNHPNGFNNVPINELLTELLYPYTKPVVGSLSLNPSAGAKEKNVSLKVNSASIKVTKKSKAIASVALYKGNTLVESKTDTISSSGTTITFTIDETLDGTADSVSYSVKVTEAGENANTVSSTAQTYNFVYPCFYGVVAKDTEITSDIITSFTKDIRTKASHSYEYTTNNACPVIAYPKSYGVLKSIIDPNNFTQDWTMYTVNVNNGSTINGVDYYVYVGGAATATATYKFNY